MADYPVETEIPQFPTATRFQVLKRGGDYSFFAVANGERYWFASITQYRPDRPHMVSVSGDISWIGAMFPSLVFVAGSGHLSSADIVKLRMMADTE